MMEQATLNKPASEKECPIPLFLEFKASGLKYGSYPIEVAWSLSEGRIESWFINPSNVPSWTVWDAEWEHTHGVSQESLRLFGRSPQWLARRMNASLAGKTLHSDGARFACYLLHRLFKAACIRPSFTLEDAGSLYRRYLAPETLGLLVTQVWRSVSHRQRAALEISRHQVLWSLIRESGGALAPEPARLRQDPVIAHRPPKCSSGGLR